MGELTEKMKSEYDQYEDHIGRFSTLINKMYIYKNQSRYVSARMHYVLVSNSKYVCESSRVNYNVPDVSIPIPEVQWP